MKTAILLITGLLLCAWATNPELRDHQDAVSAYTIQQLGLSQGNILADMAITQAAKTLVTKQDYYIFSTTQLLTTNGQITIGIGAFNHVHIYTSSLQSQNPP